MMATLYFSESTVGFYNSDINGESIPDDAVKISLAQYSKMMNGQAEGQVIAADQNGMPILKAKMVDDVAIAKNKKAELLAHIGSTTQFWQTQLQLGMITQADRDSLTRWMTFAQAVQAIDTRKAPNINWPIMPASQSLH